MSPEEAMEFERSMKNRPHVVILGAGATVASIPNGDKSGKKSSVMDGFIDKLGMSDLLKPVKLTTKSSNLEDIYSELHDRPECSEVRDELDKRIRECFLEFEIPDEPTIYDMLLASLRRKDLVATFNWDPLLPQAYQRVSKLTDDLPDLAFLHGNVLVGYCKNHPCGGYVHNKCPECDEPFTPSKLLYPIKIKNYADDPYTQDAWSKVRRSLKWAYLVTIFGYSAPKTDAEAISLMAEAWGGVDKRNLEEFEFIDIRGEAELVDSWPDFIHTHHYEVSKSFFDSTLGRFPRRTTVELFDRTMNCKWTKSNRGFAMGMGWPELSHVIESLVEEEAEAGGDGILSVDTA